MTIEQLRELGLVVEGLHNDVTSLVMFAADNSKREVAIRAVVDLTEGFPKEEPLTFLMPSREVLEELTGRKCAFSCDTCLPEACEQFWR